MKPITIIIADDHKLVREAWVMILNAYDAFRVIGDYGSAEEGIDAVKHLRPDIMLLDINLPGLSGFEAVPQIRKFSPLTKILGVSVHSLPSYARKMIQNGAMGYVTKYSPKEEMVDAIMQVYRGEKYICSHIKELIALQLTEGDDPSLKVASLSDRELQVIRFIKEGLTSKEIAEQLCISMKTVEVHRYNILRKLELKNSAELVNFIGNYLPEL